MRPAVAAVTVRSSSSARSYAAAHCMRCAALHALHALINRSERPDIVRAMMRID
jgi:hypothetical protein